VTTEGGLTWCRRKIPDRDAQEMSDAGIEVRFVIAPDEKQIEASGRTGAQFN